MRRRHRRIHINPIAVQDLGTASPRRVRLFLRPPTASRGFSLLADFEKRFKPTGLHVHCLDCSHIRAVPAYSSFRDVAQNFLKEKAAFPDTPRTPTFTSLPGTPPLASLFSVPNYEVLTAMIRLATPTNIAVILACDRRHSIVWRRTGLAMAHPIFVQVVTFEMSDRKG